MPCAPNSASEAGWERYAGARAVLCATRALPSRALLQLPETMLRLEQLPPRARAHLLGEPRLGCAAVEVAPQATAAAATEGGGLGGVWLVPMLNAERVLPEALNAQAAQAKVEDAPRPQSRQGGAPLQLNKPTVAAAAAAAGKAGHLAAPAGNEGRVELEIGNELAKQHAGDTLVPFARSLRQDAAASTEEARKLMQLRKAAHMLPTKWLRLLLLPAPPACCSVRCGCLWDCCFRWRLKSARLACRHRPAQSATARHTCYHLAAHTGVLIWQ